MLRIPNVRAAAFDPVQQAKQWETRIMAEEKALGLTKQAHSPPDGKKPLAFDTQVELPPGPSVLPVATQKMPVHHYHHRGLDRPPTAASRKSGGAWLCCPCWWGGGCLPAPVHPPAFRCGFAADTASVFSKASSRASTFSLTSSLPSRMSNFTSEAMERLERLERVRSPPYPFPSSSTCPIRPLALSACSP